MLSYLFIAALFIGMFVAGWKCCFHWHCRKPAAPTPYQRVTSAATMRAHRHTVSDALGKMFFAGVATARNLTNN